MSAIVWDGDNVFQKVGENVEELGHVKFDGNSNTVVLWLRDTQDVFGVNGGYVRGDEFPTMADAKRSAAGSVSARLLHQMWLAPLAKSGKGGRQVAQAMIGIQDDKPLTESTFNKEMAKRDKVEKRWKIISAVLALIGVALAFL